MASRPRLAIANRGEIAIRIARTAERLGWETVALLGEPDWESYAAREIGTVAHLPAGGEMDHEVVVSAAIEGRATALHPGYGFLSERPALSNACRESGITFIGPSPETLTICGDKIATRQAAIEAGVPIVEGSQALDLDQPDSWGAIATDLGFPVIAKIAGAGGGRGLRVARTEEELSAAIRSAVNEAGASAAGLSIFLEHYVEGARHVEAQVAGDGQHAVCLGDRDCSLQRRHQKVIEEAPAPGLSDELRQAIHQAAVTMAEAVKLQNLATVEFLIGSDGSFYFMEINPRLQVEHTVTEEVTGLDLVAIQLDLAFGGSLPAAPEPRGHAIQARLYAEDPFQQFLPAPGPLTCFEPPHDARIRIDTGYQSGDSVPGAFDPMIAKFISWGTERSDAIDELASALTRTRLSGIPTNRPWLLALLADARFRANEHDLATAGEITVERSSPNADELSAVATQITAASSAQHPEPWASVGSLRIVDPARIVMHDDEGQYAVTIGQAPVQSAGIAVAVANDGGYELTSPRGRWIIATGPKISQAHAGVVDGRMLAPMPARVLEIAVQVGDQVSAGQQLATLEAMKIEIDLAAPFDGTVSEVHVASGDLVGTRQPIVTVTPDQESD